MAGLDPALAWIWNLLVEATSFQEWPDGDPDTWRLLGDAWLDLAETVANSFQDMNASASNVAVSWGGDAGQAFITRWSQFVNSDDSGPAAFAAAAQDYYSACYNGALQLEYAQLMCEIILAITAAEVAIGIAFSEFGGEAFSLAAIAAGRAALTEVLEQLSTALGRQILKTALKDALKLASKDVVKTAALGALKGGVTFAAADLTAQGIQISEGYRDGINWQSIETSGAGGAAAGLTGAVTGRVIGRAIGPLTGLADRGIERSGSAFVRSAGHAAVSTTGQLLGAGLVNIPVTAAVDLTQNAITNHTFGFSASYLSRFSKHGVAGELWNEFAAGALAAGVVGGIHSGSHELLTTTRDFIGTRDLTAGSDLTNLDLTGDHLAETTLTSAQVSSLLHLDHSEAISEPARLTPAPLEHLRESITTPAERTSQTSSPAAVVTDRSGSIRVDATRTTEVSAPEPNTSSPQRSGSIRVPEIRSTTDAVTSRLDTRVHADDVLRTETNLMPMHFADPSVIHETPPEGHLTTAEPAGADHPGTEAPPTNDVPATTSFPDSRIDISNIRTDPPGRIDTSTVRSDTTSGPDATGRPDLDSTSKPEPPQTALSPQGPSDTTRVHDETLNQEQSILVPDRVKDQQPATAHIESDPQNARQPDRDEPVPARPNDVDNRFHEDVRVLPGHEPMSERLPGRHLHGGHSVDHSTTAPSPRNEHSIQEERQRSRNFDRRARSAADLPRDVHTLVDRAKDNLLSKYPASSIRARLADLDVVAAQADRVEALAEATTAGGGDLHDLIGGVRDLSHAVNHYSDTYSNWHDHTHGGRSEDPGWHDLHGVDPLDRIELAHRSVGIDPQTHRFHVLDQALVAATIEDVLGPELAEHAIHTFDRMVPKDPEAAQARLPPHAYSEDLDTWLRNPNAHGGFDPRTGLVFVESASITAVAGTVVHESIHVLQPDSERLRDFFETSPDVNSGEDEDRVKQSMLARLVFDREHRAFVVEKHFLQGLANFHPDRGYESDLRIPAERRDLTAESPTQTVDATLRKYLSRNPLFGLREPNELLGTDDILGHHPELVDEHHIVDQAITAVREMHEHGRPGTFIGPITAEIADQWHIDLDAIRATQGLDPTVPLRDLALPDRNHTPPAEPGPSTDSLQAEQSRADYPDPAPSASDDDPGSAYQPGAIHAALTGGHTPGGDVPASPPHTPEGQAAAQTRSAQDIAFETHARIETELAAHPSLTDVLIKLVDDENHPLNLTTDLQDPVRRERTLALLKELAAGETLRNQSLDTYLRENPGRGPIFEHVASDVNLNSDGESRKQEFVDGLKAQYPERAVGRDPTPSERRAVNAYAMELSERVEAEVRKEVSALCPPGANYSVRTKSAAGLFDKIGRMNEMGRPGYEVGDVIDAIGARITVEDMPQLALALNAAEQRFGVGDGGRILEIENMYADPKSRSPEYRVIPMIVRVDVDGRPYTFELQLTTRRASVAADVGHNTLYKHYHDLTDTQREAIQKMQSEAAALDQEETRQ